MLLRVHNMIIGTTTSLIR